MKLKKINGRSTTSRKLLPKKIISNQWNKKYVRRFLFYPHNQVFIYCTFNTEKLMQYIAEKASELFVV